MVMYGPICGYMAIGMSMEVEPMDVPWYVEGDSKTLVVGGMVFGNLMCVVFEVLDILKNLKLLDQEFANKPIIER